MARVRAWNVQGCRINVPMSVLQKARAGLRLFNALAGTYVACE